MVVVTGAAAVVSKVMVGAVFTVVVATVKHIPYILQAPAGTGSSDHIKISETKVTARRDRLIGPMMHKFQCVCPCGCP